jgi:CheY-like chemotaxis protein
MEETNIVNRVADGQQVAVTNILLVEDDKVDVMNVQRSFAKANITNPLFFANNGIEALEILRNESKTVKMPASRRLILLDLNMPKMGGIEFLEELRADPTLSPTPVIVLTTSNQEKDRIKAYDFNVAGYILKPLTFASFAEVMTALNRYWTLCEIP